MEWSIDEPTTAWLGALIDGEGSIMLTRHQREGGRWGFRTRAVVSVANTDVRLLQALLDRIGLGRIYEHKRPEQRHHAKLQYTWRLTANEIRVVLPRVIPWLTIKQEQARLLLEALELKDQLTPIPGRQSNGSQPERQRINEIVVEISNLNRRGVEKYA